MRFRRQILINPVQQPKKIGVLQQKMTHFVGLKAW